MTSNRIITARHICEQRSRGDTKWLKATGLARDFVQNCPEAVLSKKKELSKNTNISIDAERGSDICGEICSWHSWQVGLLSVTKADVNDVPFLEYTLTNAEKFKGNYWPLYLHLCKLSFLDQCSGCRLRYRRLGVQISELAQLINVIYIQRYREMNRKKHTSWLIFHTISLIKKACAWHEIGVEYSEKP